MKYSKYFQTRKIIQFSKSFQMGISDRDNGKILKVLSDRDFRMKKA